MSIEQQTSQPNTSFAYSDEEAERRHALTRSDDPFPTISPALLNSADIVDYVRETGMVYPFDPYGPDKKLKPASYAVSIGDLCVFWDQNGCLQERRLGDYEEFQVPRNSIVFVRTREKFRLPNYIAIRFNLQITNVHRGILLGTGPLVDPGYSGNLLIPLHNLTTNDYTFRAGDELIWVEFTKLSACQAWNKSAKDNDGNRAGTFVEFDQSKSDRPWRFYLDRARVEFRGDLQYTHESIRSSIPHEIAKAIRIAEEAKSNAASAVASSKKLAQISYWTGAGLILTVAVGIGTLLYGTWNLINKSIVRTEELAVKFRRMEGAMPKNFSAQLNIIDEAEKSRKKNAAKMASKVDNLSKRVTALEEKTRNDH